MRTYAYMRASTAEQDAARASQSLNAFAEEHGLTIAANFIENVSGASLQRPELFRLLAVAQAGDILLVEQIDRLALAGAFNAIDQHDNGRTLLLLQLVLSLKQGFAQGGNFPVVGFFIDDMTDFCGFKHGKLPGKMSQA